VNCSSAVRALARRLVTTATVAALLTAHVQPFSAATTTAERPLPTTRAQRQLTTLPTITVTLGKTLSVSAPGVRAGWANIDVTGGGRAVVARFADGYDVNAFSADYERFQSDRAGREAFARILDRTTFFGGVALGGSGSIKLPRRGTYTVMALDTYSGIKSATFWAERRTLATPDRPSTGGTIHELDGQAWVGHLVERRPSVADQPRGAVPALAHTPAGPGGHERRGVPRVDVFE
jgi:hypothetical protein